MIYSNLRDIPNTISRFFKTWHTIDFIHFWYSSNLPSSATSKVILIPDIDFWFLCDSKCFEYFILIFCCVVNFKILVHVYISYLRFKSDIYSFFSNAEFIKCTKLTSKMTPWHYESFWCEIQTSKTFRIYFIFNL